MPALTSPCSDLDFGQPQGHHAGAPSQRYQAPGNNYVTPPQLPISFHASRQIFISENSRNRFGIAWKNRECATDVTENLQCRIESNQLSRTSVRGLLGTRFVRLFFLSASSSEVGAATSKSEPDTSVRGNPGSFT